MGRAPGCTLRSFQGQRESRGAGELGSPLRRPRWELSRLLLLQQLLHTSLERGECQRS